MHLYEVLRRPLITEKNTVLQTQNKYVFEVLGEANKVPVKSAVEKAFKVHVKAVNVVILPGKAKRVGRRIVQTRSWKKAIVTIQAGEKIEFFEGV